MKEQKKLTGILIDILFVIFLIYLAIRYISYISDMWAPIWDGATYLVNARGWLYNTELLEIYRPPFISWLTSGIWLFTGDNWTVIKPLQAVFTIGAGIILYVLIRKHKGELFAFSVVVLTMLNPQVFVYSSQILTEGFSLFFLVLTLYLIKSDNEKYWFLAGIAMGLTFASRYYIIIQAIAILITECKIRKNWKLFVNVSYGAIPTVSIVILLMILKTGTFQSAVEGAHVGSLSLFYLTHSIDIWGPIFYLVPIAFLFRSTYADKYNYTFIIWYIVAIIFWSANAGNYQYRFAIQFTPAVYYLAILAIENIAKNEITIEKINLRSILLIYDISKTISLSKKILKEFVSYDVNKSKIYFAMVIIFWSCVIIVSPPYIKYLRDSVGFDSSLTGYYNYDPNSGKGFSYSNSTCHFEFPNKPTVIIRMDDVQAYAWNAISINITQTVVASLAPIKMTDQILSKNRSIVLGVIPKDIGDDPVMKKYLIDKSKDSRIEISLHGTNHRKNEFLNLSESETYNLAMTGMNTMINVLNVHPVTFIPPDDYYNNNTTKALSRLGLVVLSAKGEYKSDGYMNHIGYTVLTKYSDRKELTSVDDILNSCKTALADKNLCVIDVHPQDYTKEDGITLDENKYDKFTKLLEELDKSNVTFSTFKDMINCK